MAEKNTITYDVDLVFFLHQTNLLNLVFKISKLSPTLNELDKVSRNDWINIGLKEEQIDELKKKYRDFDGDKAVKSYFTKLLLFLLLGVTWVFSFLYCNISLYDSIYAVDGIFEGEIKEWFYSGCMKEWYFLIFYILIFSRGLFYLFVILNTIIVATSIVENKFNKVDIYILRLNSILEKYVIYICIIMPFFLFFILYKSYTWCDFPFFSINSLTCIINFNGFGFVANFFVAIVIWSYVVFIPLGKGIYKYLYNKETEIDFVDKSHIGLLIRLQKYINKNSTKISMSAIILAIVTFLGSLFGAFADGLSTIENIGYVSKKNTVDFTDITFQKDSSILTIINKADYPVTINSVLLTINNLKIENTNFIIDSTKGNDRHILNQDEFTFGNSRIQNTKFDKIKSKEIKLEIAPKNNLKLYIDSGLNEHYGYHTLKLVKFDISVIYDLTKSVAINDITQLVVIGDLPQSYQNCQLYFYLNQIKSSIIDENSKKLISSNSILCNCK